MGQAYNPEIFRPVGVGVINGAIWTITTEILFYLLVPILVFFRNIWKYSIYLLATVSFIFYSVGEIFLGGVKLGSRPVFEYLVLTPLIWGWMFGLGMLAVENFRLIEKYIKFGFLAIPVLLFIGYLDINNPIFSSAGNE